MGQVQQPGPTKQAAISTPPSELEKSNRADRTQGGGEFAKALAQRRRGLGLSLAQLGERVGCAKSYLSGIETGRRGPPTAAIIERLERALGVEPGTLVALASWDQTPSAIRDDLTQLRRRDRKARQLAQMLASSASEGVSLDELYASGRLRSAIDRISPPAQRDAPGATGLGAPVADPGMLPMEVPVINKVTAGYPADFTDMGFPARVGDEYIRTPDLHDPDAFAARVVGDSMEPDYREGDIVVFSPARPVGDGADCFVRFEPDHESTFKRVYFQRDEGGNELIRIQPINNRYPPRTVAREQVAGLYAGVSVTRSIG